MTADASSPDVCYRHPQRESWVLCQRCGRTICPECQILTPQGVRCPDCVRETGGSVQWSSAGGEPKRPTSKAKPTRPRRASAGSNAGSGSPVAQRMAEMLRPGGETPVATFTILGIVLVLWIVGFLLPSSVAPATWLAALADRPLEVWRYFTAPFAYPSVFQVVLSILLSVVFFALIAPAVEKSFGRRTFLLVFFAGAALGSASMIIAGGLGAYGLTGALFGLFGAYIVKIWSYPQARVQVLIMVGINLVLGIVTGGLPQIVGGLVAGAGSAYLLQRYEGRHIRTAYSIIGAVVAGFIVLAIARSLAF